MQIVMYICNELFAASIEDVPGSYHPGPPQ